MHSLRSRLVVVWLLSLAASVAVGLILVGLYRQSTGAQLDRAAAAVAEACDAIGDRFAFYATGWAGPLPAPGTAEAASFAADLDQLLAVALAGRAGVAGGLWLDDAPLASTMPLASDLRATIAALAAEDERTAGTRIVANGAASTPSPSPACPTRPARNGCASASPACSRWSSASACCSAGQPSPGRAASAASSRPSPPRAAARFPMSSPPASTTSTAWSPP
jgi:hypothetical protein